MKRRSTTTGADVGLRSETHSVLEPAVDPEAKYQLADVELWQGTIDQPAGPWTACDTDTPPPSRVTVSASNEPDDGTASVGVTTLSAGTETMAFTVAPVSVTIVMFAVTARVAELESTSRPAAAFELVVCPVQYQADDSASGALTSDAGVGGVAAGLCDPRVPTKTATPTMTAATTTRTGQRR
jgi:hypothetical protein